MYFGEVKILLDDKNRLTLPSRFRKTLEKLNHKEWFMARGYDGCIFLIPDAVWEGIQERTSQLATLDARAVVLRRMLFGSVQDVTPDSQGRMPVPENLRLHADLDKEAVLVGAEDHIELWSRSAWRQWQRDNEQAYKEMTSNFFAGTNGHSPVEEKREA